MMPPNRPYQQGFYLASTRVRDAKKRAEEAQKIVRALRPHLDSLGSGLTCVDVGCSSGLITARLAAECDRSIGVEFDPIALAATPRPCPTGLAFVRGDALALPLPTGSVDVLICAQVYEHVAQDTQLFEELHRVLRPTGIVFLSGPNWLFPIEPHFGLPFLHWLPRRVADRWLSSLGRGTHYYERSRTYWALRRALRVFNVIDVGSQVVRDRLRQWHGLGKALALLPMWEWRPVLVLLPNFNWILTKRA